jgi:hypothetical protein
VAACGLMQILSANPADVSSFFAIKLDIQRRSKAERTAKNGFLRASRSRHLPHESLHARDSLANGTFATVSGLASRP